MVPGVFGFLVMRYVTIDSYRTFFLFCVTYVLLYAVCLWGFGLNEEEKSMVTRVTDRLKRMVRR